jgi:hypothetical protein
LSVLRGALRFIRYVVAGWHAESKSHAPTASITYLTLRSPGDHHEASLHQASVTGRSSSASEGLLANKRAPVLRRDCSLLAGQRTLAAAVCSGPGGRWESQPTSQQMNG